MSRRDTGALGEKLAQDFLKKHGYRILQTNFRCPEGEIDIIARDKDCLVFVEVKARTSLRFGLPEEAIDENKKRKIRLAAARYQQENHQDFASWRIDVVAIELGAGNRPTRIELIENAITE